MGINLLSYPYHDTTKTYRGITYTDNFNGSITLNGTTAGSISGFDLKYGSDALVLPQGTYIIRGTGSDTVKFRVRYYDVDDNLLGYFETTTTRTFLMDETDHSIRVDIRIPSRTTVNNLTVYPQIEAGTELSPWTPYRPPTTINAENAKQIRQTMDVIIQVTPEQGDPIVINNDNLISCTVSLRSDLSIIEPTLPESEINIEAYFDEDISDVLASIPDETPVTYQAGYPGDMSPVRNFYLAEQITWRDNVMSIHAVDAVHKLDKTTEPVSIGDTDCVISVEEYGTSIYDIMVLFYYYAMNAGIDIVSYESIPPRWKNPYWSPASKVNKGIRQKRALLGRGHTYRDVLAELMNCFHFSDIDPQFIETYSARWENFWPTYVDAGIPTLTVSKPATKWDIYEDDCGNVDRKTGRKIQSIKATLYDVNSAAITQNVTRDLNYALNSKVGSFDWEKNGGGVLSFDSEYIFAFVIGVESSKVGGSALKISPMVPIDSYGWPAIDTDEVEFRIDNRGYDFRGHYLIDSQTLYGTVPGNHTGEYVYTQTIPWDCTYDSVSQEGFSYKWRGSSNVWTGLVNAGVISSDTTQVTLDVYGFSMNEALYEQTYQSGEQGGSDESTEFLLRGHVWMTNECDFDDSEIEPTVIVELFPQKAVESLMSRSNITGSFTWKGDPRMQPRDVVTFHRLDGTTEDITIENITITHEKGGTSAEITYRKGIC